MSSLDDPMLKTVLSILRRSVVDKNSKGKMAMYLVSRKTLARMLNGDPRSRRFMEIEPTPIMLCEDGFERPLFAIEIQD